MPLSILPIGTAEAYSREIVARMPAAAISIVDSFAARVCWLLLGQQEG